MSDDDLPSSEECRGVPTKIERERLIRVYRWKKRGPERLRLTEVVRKFNDRHARTLGWAGILYVHARGSTKIDHGVLVPRSYVDEMHRLVEQRREREP